MEPTPIEESAKPPLPRPTQRPPHWEPPCLASQGWLRARPPNEEAPLSPVPSRLRSHRTGASHAQGAS
eukprot:3086925-Amphidinium_carterae.1